MSLSAACNIKSGFITHSTYSANSFSLLKQIAHFRQQMPFGAVKTLILGCVAAILEMLARKIKNTRTVWLRWSYNALPGYY